MDKHASQGALQNDRFMEIATHADYIHASISLNCCVLRSHHHQEVLYYSMCTPTVKKMNV